MESPLKRLSVINVYSADKHRMVDFFQEKLGLAPLPGQDKKDDYFGFHLGNLQFGIEPESNRDDIPLSFNRKNPILIQFEAESLEHLEEINQFLESKGIDLPRRSQKMSYGFITNFVDPDGNLYEVLYMTE